MLTREQLDELLVDYLYDELSAEDRKAFEAAAADHPEVAEEVAAHRQTRNLMAEMPMVDPPQPVLDNIMRAARHAAAPSEEPMGFWAKLLSVFAQPAFATAAVVAGVGLTAFLTMSGPGNELPGGTKATSGAPVVATADDPTKQRGTRPADENLNQPMVASAKSEASKTPSEEAAPTPLPAAGGETDLAQAKPTKDIAPAEPKADNKQLQVAAAPKKAKTRTATKRKTTAKPAKPEAAPIEVAAVDKAPADQLAKSLGAATPREAELKAAEADVAKPASLNNAPARPEPSVSTHPGVGDSGANTPANAGPRLTKKFGDLVKAGKLSEAAKVLSQLEKLPTTSKAAAKKLRKQLDAAKAAQTKKAAPAKK